MLRRFFANCGVGSSNAPPQSNNAAAAVNPVVSGSMSQLLPLDTTTKSAVSEAVRDDDSGFPLLVSRLEDFEGRLKSVINALSRHCQAITEVAFSSKSLTSGLQDVFINTASHLQQDQQQQEPATATQNWIPLVAEFRTSTIAPLQALLADIPQLKMLCDHRNSALALKIRYDKKIDEIESASRYESTRLQRNRVKHTAASVRFLDLDVQVRSDIARLLTRDISELLGNAIEKTLMDAQALATKQLEADALALRQHIEAAKAASRAAASVSLPDKSHTKHHPSEPEESDIATLAPPPPPLELAPSPVYLALTATATASISVMPPHVRSEAHGVLPRKKHVYGTRTWNLHKHIKDSMATGLDVTECVQLPDGYALEEWVAVHTIDFFNEISLLYGTITEFCTATTCPQMSAGPCYAYLWADGKQQVAPIALAAPEYVDRLMHWVQVQLDDPDVFPLDGAYDRLPMFLSNASVILKRLFRVYAHMYHSHLPTFAALEAESHLNFCFKRFVLFVKAFELVDQKELNALRKLIQTLTTPSQLRA